MFRNLLIATAIFGLGWGASFGAGVAYARRSTPAVQAAQIAGQNGTSAQAQGGTAAFALGGGQGARVAGGTVGVVSAVAGNTLTVTGANNQTAKVSVTDQTRILKEAAGTIQDLPAGTRIAVQPQGQPAADGTITAATIQVVPEGAAAAPAGGQAQRQQGQQGGGQPRQPQQGAG